MSGIWTQIKNKQFSSFKKWRANGTMSGPLSQANVRVRISKFPPNIHCGRILLWGSIKVTRLSTSRKENWIHFQVLASINFWKFLQNHNDNHRRLSNFLTIKESLHEIGWLGKTVTRRDKNESTLYKTFKIQETLERRVVETKKLKLTLEGEAVEEPLAPLCEWN